MKPVRRNNEWYLPANQKSFLIWKAGRDAERNYFNGCWLSFRGRTLEQEGGYGWIEGVHPGDRRRCFSMYFDGFNRKEMFEMQYRLRRHDGEYRWIHDLVIPLHDPTGTFNGLVGSCTDITDQILCREHVPGAGDGNLKAEVGLDAGLVGSLTGGIAHDFNDILTIIMGAGTLLRSRIDKDPELDHFVDQILDCSERAASLVQCLLELSRNRLEQPLVPAGKVRRKQRDHTRDASAGNGATILVVENDARLRNSMKELLKCAGYTVLSTSTGDEAVEHFTRSRGCIALVILGHSVSGEEYLHCRLRSVLPEIKILFVGGHGGAVLESGGDGGCSLAGPLESLTLLGRVRTLLAV